MNGHRRVLAGFLVTVTAMFGCSAGDDLPQDDLDLLRALPSAAQRFTVRFDWVDDCLRQQGFSYRSSRFILPESKSGGLLELHNDLVVSRDGYGFADALKVQFDARAEKEPSKEEQLAFSKCDGEFDDSVKQTFFKSTYELSDRATKIRSKFLSRNDTVKLNIKWSKCMRSKDIVATQPADVSLLLNRKLEALMPESSGEPKPAAETVPTVRKFAEELGRSDSECTAPLVSGYLKIEKEAFAELRGSSADLMLKATNEAK